MYTRKISSLRQSILLKKHRIRAIIFLDKRTVIHQTNHWEWVNIWEFWSTDYLAPVGVLLEFSKQLPYTNALLDSRSNFILIINVVYYEHQRKSDSQFEFLRCISSREGVGQENFLIRSSRIVDLPKTDQLTIEILTCWPYWLIS